MEDVTLTPDEMQELDQYVESVYMEGSDTTYCKYKGHEKWIGTKLGMSLNTSTHGKEKGIAYLKSTINYHLGRIQAKKFNEFIKYVDSKEQK